MKEGRLPRLSTRSSSRKQWTKPVSSQRLQGDFLERKQLLFCLLAGLLHATTVTAFASPYTMKGPAHSSPVAPDIQAQPASPVRNVLLGAIHFYRQVISPTQGGRCGFYPSCSTFGMHALQHYGALKGSMLTADRLTRCNIFKQPGPDYYLRPDGRLYDPVEANLLKDR